MTRTTTRTRLLVVLVAALTVLLAVATSTSRTAAAWNDRAGFRATASAGTWAAAPGERCEIVTTGTAPRVLGTCTITSVQATNQWGSAGPDGYVTGGGFVFQVSVSGYTPQAGQQVRFTVDLSRVTGTTGRWNWSAGSVSMHNGVLNTWEPPFLTSTAYEYNPSPFGGQFTAP